MGKPIFLAVSWHSDLDKMARKKIIVMEKCGFMEYLVARYNVNKKTVRKEAKRRKHGRYE